MSKKDLPSPATKLLFRVLLIMLIATLVFACWYKLHDYANAKESNSETAQPQMWSTSLGRRRIVNVNAERGTLTYDDHGENKTVLFYGAMFVTGSGKDSMEHVTAEQFAERWLECQLTHGDSVFVLETISVQHHTDSEPFTQLAYIYLY